jgi:hypothetical protein
MNGLKYLIMAGVLIQYTRYMDFMKAFDKVPHRRLIKKMEGYGIGKRILNWVKDFLKNRKQNVSVNGAESACQDVTRGIPQGSVPECVDAVAYLFADDTKLYKEIKREEDRETTKRPRQFAKMDGHLAIQIPPKQVQSHDSIKQEETRGNFKSIPSL